MTITLKNENGTVSILMEGWLDHESSPQLGAVIEEITSAEKLVLDFSRVEYISSAGIRMLVSAHRKAKDLNAEFSLVHVNDTVINILAMTGLDKKLNIQK